MDQDTPTKRRIFISYAHKDGGELASRLHTDLQRQKSLVPWLDEVYLKVGDSWSKELERALDHSDIVLALLSKGSFVSDVCRAEQLRSLRAGKTVLPLMVQTDADRPLHLETKQFLDFSDPAKYDEQLVNLLKSVSAGESASLPAKYRATYVTVPPVSSSYVPRSEVIAKLRHAVIDEEPPIGNRCTVVQGMAGLGKSVLAQMLCHDEVIKASFPDGVVWLTIGREAKDLMATIREAGKALGDSPTLYDTMVGSTNQLRTNLEDKAVLLVLDDVWDPRDVNPFRTDAARTRLLITTRENRVATGLGVTPVILPALTFEESLDALARWSGRTRLPPEATEVAERCGRLPLAVAMVGASMRGKSDDRWKNVLQKLEGADLRRIRQTFPEYPYPSLFAAMDVSVSDLVSPGSPVPESKRRYLELGIFPKKTAIPQTVLTKLWQLGSYPTQDLVDELVDRSLGAYDERGCLVLHDLQLDYARAELGKRAREVHQRLLDAFNPVWCKKSNEPYDIVINQYYG